MMTCFCRYFFQRFLKKTFFFPEISSVALQRNPSGFFFLRNFSSGIFLCRDFCILIHSEILLRIPEVSLGFLGQIQKTLQATLRNLLRELLSGALYLFLQLFRHFLKRFFHPLKISPKVSEAIFLVHYIQSSTRNISTELLQELKRFV